MGEGNLLDTDGARTKCDTRRRKCEYINGSVEMSSEDVVGRIHMIGQGESSSGKAKVR